VWGLTLFVGRVAEEEEEEGEGPIEHAEDQCETGHRPVGSSRRLKRTHAHA
jgi:hypothetical protein